MEQNNANDQEQIYLDENFEILGKSSFQKNNQQTKTLRAFTDPDDLKILEKSKKKLNLNFLRMFLLKKSYFLKLFYRNELWLGYSS